MAQAGLSGRQRAVERTCRAEHAGVVAALVARYGDLELAEDATAEAQGAAREQWPVEGIPAHPDRWLASSATRRAIDRLRREARREARRLSPELLQQDEPPPAPDPRGDLRVALLFTCCHPALPSESRVALTLRMLGGLTPGEIAEAFLVPETTVAARLARARQAIKDDALPFGMPQGGELDQRLRRVLAVLHQIFTEGYRSGSPGAAPVRAQLSDEAIRLTRLLRRVLRDQAEVTGLLALMLLTQARRDARLDGGALVPLAEQDRSRWDRELIVEGHDLVRECLALNRPGRFQLLAAVNAVHTDAATAAETDWRQIETLYGHLEVVAPGPLVSLNRAVAVAELDGPEIALRLVDRLPGEHPTITTTHAWHVTRADLLRRAGREAEALTEYDAAIGATINATERAYLRRQRDRLAK